MTHTPLRWTLAHYALACLAFLAVIIGGTAFGYLAGASLAQILALIAAWAIGALIGAATVIRGQADVVGHIWSSARWTVGQVSALVQWSGEQPVSEQYLFWLQRALLEQSADRTGAYFALADTVHLLLQRAILDGQCQYCGSRHPSLLSPTQKYDQEAHQSVIAWGNQSAPCPVPIGAALYREAQQKKATEEAAIS